MIVVNLFSGPGAGKTTLAMYLTSFFKQRGMNVEYASEFVKDAVFEDNTGVIRDQLFILANQQRSLYRLERNGIDIAITDSPILNSAIYARFNKTFPHKLDSFYKFTYDVFNSYNNVNIFLNRKNVKYQTTGRIHNSEQAIELDSYIREYLNKYNVYYEDTECKSIEEIPLMIIEYIVRNSTSLNLSTNDTIWYAEFYTILYNDMEKNNFMKHLFDEHVKKLNSKNEVQKENE